MVTKCPKCGSENTRIVYTVLPGMTSIGTLPSVVKRTRKHCLSCDHWWFEYDKKEKL